MPNQANVEVVSAALSKINWAEAIKILAMIAATKGVNLPPDIQNDILMAIIGFGGVATWIMRTWFTTTITPSSAAKVTGVFFLCLFLAMFASVSNVRASDLNTKALPSLISNGYPSLKCGMYYGLNTMGSTGSVNNAAVGTQIAQGDIGATLGYACPLSADGSSFVFADGFFDFSNLNGSTNGLALSGPATFMQRVGLGSPISTMLNFFPSLNFPALPAIMPLPAGVTAGPSNPYMFAAIHEQAIGASVGLASGKEWLISPGIGVGMKTRLSNNVVFDTFAEWQMKSSSLCVGPISNGCTTVGNTARVGFALEY